MKTVFIIFVHQIAVTTMVLALKIMILSTIIPTILNAITIIMMIIPLKLLLV